MLVERGLGVNMIIGLGSQSQIKIDAVLQAAAQRGFQAALRPVMAESGVASQPFDGETYCGAINRVIHAAQLVRNFDVCLAIENGIFVHDGRYYDVLVVVARTPVGRMYLTEGEMIEFPADAVQEAIQLAGTKTVGKILQERGLVADPCDPHSDLVGKSRARFIQEAVSDVLRMVFD
jgi:non-canonical (house-cleaning) NTP pyrophosphatase